MITSRSILFLPLVLTFILLNSLLLVSKSFAQKAGLNRDFVIMFNLFFFVLSLAGFFLQRKGLQSNNTNVFIRGVYSAILLKLFVSVIAVLIFAFSNRKSINAPLILSALVLYVIYTSIEVSMLIKVTKRKNDAKERITS